MEKKLKHLDFLQLVITRMNVNSFFLKGWAITLVVAIFAFAAKDSDTNYIFIAYFSTPMFWLLDGYYLSLERKYRDLYNVVRLKDENDIDFDLNANSFKSGKNSWISSIFAISLALFYGTLVAITLGVMIYLRHI